MASKPKNSYFPKNKIPEEDLNKVREHINSFPRLQSHYTRKDTHKEYLDSALNVKKMYELYSKRYENPVEEHKYRSVFTTEFNLDFFQPKKDQCMTCAKLKTANDKEKLIQHHDLKERARKEKATDKKEAKIKQNLHVVTFDLQQVLNIPKSNVSAFYYKRKLCMYNLTVYDVGSKAVKCYVWPEYSGKRGACEIGTCLIKYIQSLPVYIDHVILYSDCCAGQNRNRFIFTGMLYALQQCDNIKVIEQKFLVSGHTQMEADSVHAAIENAQRNISIYTENDWATVIRLARRKNPYTVVNLHNTSFIDLKQMADVNPKMNINGEKVQFMKICHFVYRKDSDYVQYRHSYDEVLQNILIKRTQTRTTAYTAMQESPLYMKELPISKAKKKDIESLCSSGAIPKFYHAYYEGIPCSISEEEDFVDIEELSNDDE